jgi:hypothetical protein
MADLRPSSDHPPEILSQQSGLKNRHPPYRFNWTTGAKESSRAALTAPSEKAADVALSGFGIIPSD